jgi:hypothetical protein
MGVCVGIRSEKIVGKRLLPVEYSEHLPFLDAWEYVFSEGDTFVKLSLTKAAHWAYEKEWRTINAPGVVTYPGCVDKLVIGLRASNETRTAAREAVAESGREIEILETKLSQEKYALEVVGSSVNLRH